MTAKVSAIIPPAPDALHSAERDELEHALRQAGQERAEQEDQDRGEEHRAAPVDVAQLAVERRADGGAQQVGGDHPRVVVEPAELADDRRERRRHDRLVQGGQEQTGHQAAEDDQDLPVRERRGCGRGSHGSYRMPGTRRERVWATPRSFVPRSVARRTSWRARPARWRAGCPRGCTASRPRTSCRRNRSATGPWSSRRSRPTSSSA